MPRPVRTKYHASALAHLEIERKFLVQGGSWRGAGRVSRIRQAYLSTDPARVVRVRVADGRGFLTVKGSARGAARLEVEVELPIADAEALLELALGFAIEKDRHLVEHSGFTWEVDEFLNENAGLVVAELEVEDEADFARALGAPPAWLGREVTGEARLANAALAVRPFSTWSEDERAALSRK